MTRIYLSNIRSQWPIGRQEELLDQHLPDWRSGTVFRDMVSRAVIKNQTKLPERDGSLLREHGRDKGDVLYVASISVLAWTPTDLMAVLMRLATRRDTLNALAENMEIDPTQTNLDALKTVFTSATRRISALGVSGGDASGKLRSARARAAVEQMRPLWGLPSEDENTTAALCERFGVSRPTAILYLGSRRAAQQRYQASLKIADSNRRRKKRGPEQNC